MVQSKTHNEFTLHPPPGTRFSIWGSDVLFEFPRGEERAIVDYLHAWIAAYLEPEAVLCDERKCAEEAEPVKASVRAAAKRAFDAAELKRLSRDIEQDREKIKSLGITSAPGNDAQPEHEEDYETTVE